MTDDQLTAKLQAAPGKCPQCGQDASVSIAGDEGVRLDVEAACSNCNVVWYEFYDFVRAYGLREYKGRTPP